MLKSLGAALQVRHAALGVGPDRETWRLAPWLLLAAFLVRAAFAFSTDGVAHPDELFQYYEQGHRLAYGAGLVPWEYVQGIRSWIIPGAIALFLAPFKLFGIDSPYVYQPALDLVLCAISLVLPWCMYRISQTMFSENTARLALIFGCFWYQIVVLAHRPLADALSVYSFFATLALTLDRPRTGTMILAGALAALTVLLRFQMLPVIGVIGLVGLLRWRVQVWIPAASFAVVMLMGGALDAYTWGVWFASIVINVDFNLVQNVASEFGVSPPYFYLYVLLLASAGLVVPGIAGLAITWRRSWPLLASLVITVAIFSLISHKEPRFIFLATPAWLIGLAALVDAPATRKLLSRPQAKWTAPAACVALALISVAGSARAFPRQWEVDQGSGYFANATRQAYRYLSTRSDVIAVIDDKPFDGGGYYDLHHRVPVYYAEEWTAGGAEARSNPALYASHVLMADGQAGPAGFSKLAQFGSVVIWRRDTDPAQTPVAAGYNGLMKSPWYELPPKVVRRW